MSAEGKFQVQGFQGTVHLKHWQKDPVSGQQFMGVMGRVSILSAKEATGMTLTNQESNWLARIEGPTTSYNFPGCQVSGVFDHPNVFEVAASVRGEILLAT